MGAAKERNQTQTSPLKKPLNVKAKSKRDLMEDVLQKGSKSDYIPAGFFMHFNKKGDEAVKGGGRGGGSSPLPHFLTATSPRSVNVFSP